VTSVSEARVLEAAQALAANAVAIRRLTQEIRAQTCEEWRAPDFETNDPGRPPCYTIKQTVNSARLPESDPDHIDDEVSPWWGMKLTAQEIGEKYGYCASCVGQVDRQRARKAAKARKGGLLNSLIRNIAIMEKKAQVKA
jgi:hypothetical protein